MPACSTIVASPSATPADVGFDAVRVPLTPEGLGVRVEVAADMTGRPGRTSDRSCWEIPARSAAAERRLFRTFQPVCQHLLSGAPWRGAAGRCRRVAADLPRRNGPGDFPSRPPQLTDEQRRADAAGCRPGCRFFCPFCCTASPAAARPRSICAERQRPAAGSTAPLVVPEIKPDAATLKVVRARFPWAGWSAQRTGLRRRANATGRRPAGEGQRASCLGTCLLFSRPCRESG